MTADRAQAWQAACIEALQASSFARLQCLVSRLRPEPESKDSALDRFYAQRNVASLHKIDASAFADWSQEADAVSLEGGARDRERLAALDLDFLLAFDAPSELAGVENVPRFGTWRFYLADLERFTSEAPGFWEVFHGEPVTAAFLVKLGDVPSEAVVLKSAHLSTVSNSVERNAELICSVLPQWPVAVCRDIENGAAAYFQATPLAMPRLHRGTPGELDIARVAVTEKRRTLEQYLRGAFYKVDWNIGRIAQSPSDFIGRETSAEVAFFYSPQRGRYLADPCVVQFQNRMHLFCEEYDYGTGRGIVVEASLAGGVAQKPKAVISENYHLSYPHIFEQRGRLYCIPESNLAHKVCLYECVEFPRSWRQVKTIISDFGGADNTVVFYEGRWWLFCTSSELLRRGYNSHLYVFYADDVFGPWTPHVRNPVKIDVRSSRPAGPFFLHGGQLHRPAQDCSGSYGELLRINRIEALTKTDFRETVVGVIRPPAGRYNGGIHTISAAEGYSVVDARRYVFNPNGFVRIAKDAVKATARGFGITISLRRPDSGGTEKSLAPATRSSKARR